MLTRSFMDKKDLDYVVEAHGRIYGCEYQYDDSFVRFVAEGVSAFERNYKAEREMFGLLNWMVNQWAVSGLRDWMSTPRSCAGFSWSQKQEARDMAVCWWSMPYSFV
jgi:hypothetical protein